MATDKTPTPAYASFKSFNTFFAARRDDGHVTTVVDRSLMSNFSGSTTNELLAALRFLGLTSEGGKPTVDYAEYVEADDARRKELLDGILRRSYAFVWNTPGFDLERGTSAQMTEVFRAQGISGSTLVRAITFFLAAAKEAGIKVSPNIKVQQRAKNGNPRPKKESATAAPSAGAKPDGEEVPPATTGSQTFEIPIPINRKVHIRIPADWSSADWDLFQTMLGAYITGWKAMTSKPKEEDDGL